MVTHRMTGSFFFHDIQYFHVPYSAYSSRSWIFMVLHTVLNWTLTCRLRKQSSHDWMLPWSRSRNIQNSGLWKFRKHFQHPGKVLCLLIVYSNLEGIRVATLVVMSQWCLCFVCPCATYLPRRWKSFRREPPSCPRAAGKPWLLRDLGQMLPRKRQKRRNLVDFCADPGRKWPWYAKEAIQIDTFDTVSWNGPTYLWVCQTCWMEINTNIHDHSCTLKSWKVLEQSFSFKEKRLTCRWRLVQKTGVHSCVI